jgi:hypothetical protein
MAIQAPWRNTVIRKLIVVALLTLATVQTHAQVLTPADRAAIRDVLIPMLARWAAEPVDPVKPTRDPIIVKEGQPLQPVLDAAKAGDIIEIPSGTFTGNFVLKTAHAAYVTVRGAATLHSPSNEPVLATAHGASYWRIQGLTFTAASHLGDAITFGSYAQTLAQVPHHLELSDCFVKGNPITGLKRGIALNSAHTTITRCQITDVKLIGQDTQAIGGWNGPGPYTITHNLLEAAGENIMFGGSDPSIQGLIPSDIEIAHNIIRKPLAWRTQPWQMKNLVELKVGKRVVFRRNLLENNWETPHGEGFAIWLKSVNQDGTQPWAEVSDVLFEDNTIRNVASGVSLHYGPQGISVPMSRITFRNNHFEISRAKWGGRGWFALVVGINDLTLDHNTIIQDGSVGIMFDGPTSDRFVMTGNILTGGEYGAIRGNATGHGSVALNLFAPGAVVKENLIVTPSPQLYPSGNTVVTTMPASTTGFGYVPHE